MVERMLMMRGDVGSILHSGPIELLPSPTNVPRFVKKAVVCTLFLCGIEYLKDLLLLIGQSGTWRGGSGFTISLCERSLPICPTAS